MINRIALLLFIGLALPIYGQSSAEPKRNELISERHPNGLKKFVLVFEGEGIDEILVSKYGFYDNGLKSFIESYNNNKKHGKCLYWYSNGYQKAELNYNDNKLDGDYTQWNENGETSINSIYKDDKLNGAYTEWNLNGVKIAEGNYRNDDKIDSWTYWYDSGKKKSQKNYVNGNINGLSTSWHENGEKQSEGNYKNGEKDGKWNSYTTGGKKNLEETYVGGSLSGPLTIYYDNGQKSSYGIKEGRYYNGLYTEWHENGKKKIEANTSYNNYDGPYTAWNENGRKVLEGTYVKGEKNGLFTFYNEDEKIEKEITYQNGKVYEEFIFTYHSNGERKSRESWIDGKKNGLYIGWYDNGNKSDEKNYKDGLAYGKWIQYNRDGSFSREGFKTSDGGNLTKDEAMASGVWPFTAEEKLAYDKKVEQERLEHARIAEEKRKEEKRLAKERRRIAEEKRRIAEEIRKDEKKERVKFAVKEILINQIELSKKFKGKGEYPNGKGNGDVNIKFRVVDYNNSPVKNALVTVYNIQALNYKRLNAFDFRGNKEKEIEGIIWKEEHTFKHGKVFGIIDDNILKKQRFKRRMYNPEYRDKDIVPMYFMGKTRKDGYIKIKKLEMNFTYNSKDELYLIRVFHNDLGIYTGIYVFDVGLTDLPLIREIGDIKLFRDKENYLIKKLREGT
jgi:antitoxin component YwqK of YwqJK toxin-antitoxin module